MILPNTKFPLLAFADQSNISQSAILDAVEKGVIDYFLNAWMAYAVQELKERSMLDDQSPTSALDLGRRIFEDIAVDFKEQFEAENAG